MNDRAQFSEEVRSRFGVLPNFFCTAASAPGLIDDLAPFTDRIANIGQVGVVGSVASAVARLHTLLGDPGTARGLLERARALAERTEGRPTLLSVRLNQARLAPPSRELAAEVAALEADAGALGMAHIAAAAAELGETLEA